MPALTSDSGNAWTASVPNVWRRSSKVAGSDFARIAPRPARSSEVEALAQRRAVEVTAELAREHEVVRAGEQLAPAESVERLHRLVDQRHRADVPGLRRSLLAERVAATHVHEALGEVDVSPAQREQFAKP